MQNKNSATRFQILVEIAAAGTGVRQRDIARKLGITPQAVSNYIRNLVQDGMLTLTGRSGYGISVSGVNWVLRMLRELNDYVAIVTRAVTNITVCAAVAESDMAGGQAVGLKMKDGILFATDRADGSARGIAVSGVRRGEDVDVSHIEGLVDLPKGKVTVLQVPGIDRGGSKQADLRQLQILAGSSGGQQVGAIGIEALVALRRAGIEPRYFYGVAEAAVEAARCGLSFAVVCTADAVPALVKRLHEAKLDYQVIDLSKVETV